MASDSKQPFPERGETPAWRAGHPPEPLARYPGRWQPQRWHFQPSPRGWTVVRIIWLLPAIVPLCGFVFLGLWFAASIAFGHGAVPIWLIALVSVGFVAERIPRVWFVGLPLAFAGQSREIRTRGDLLLDLGRSYVVTIYAGYAVLFWAAAILILWAWLL